MNTNTANGKTCTEDAKKKKESRHILGAVRTIPAVIYILIANAERAPAPLRNLFEHLKLFSVL